MSNLLNNILFFFYSRCSYKISIVVNKRLLRRLYSDTNRNIKRLVSPVIVFCVFYVVHHNKLAMRRNLKLETPAVFCAT